MDIQFLCTVKVVYNGFGYNVISHITFKFSGPEISAYVLYMRNFGYNVFVYNVISHITFKCSGPDAYLPIQISSLITVKGSADTCHRKMS